VEHSEIGGRILSRWNFPESLVRAVWHHHDPAVASEFERLASCVYLADVLAHCLGYGHGHQPFAVRGRGEAFSILGVKPDEIDTLVLQTDRALRKTAWLPGAA
jgi:HD-like signal output (HDOD) protein